MNRYKLKKSAVPYLFLLPFMVIYLLFFSLARSVFSGLKLFQIQRLRCGKVGGTAEL